MSTNGKTTPPHPLSITSPDPVRTVSSKHTYPDVPTEWCAQGQRTNFPSSPGRDWQCTVVILAGEFGQCIVTD